MKDLLNRIFFDAEGSGASGEPAGQPSPPAQTQGTPQGGQDSLRGQRPKNVNSFLKSAPVMGTPKTGQPPGPEGGIPAPQAPAAQPEGGATPAAPKPEEPLVKGPGSTQQPNAEGTQQPPPAGEEPKGEPAGPTEGADGKLKIGDLSYTAEEWERFAKDYANDTTWKANNSKRSQLINKFSDELLNDLAPFALSQRELPADFKKKLTDLQKLPETFTVKDADGYDQEISIADLPDDVINAIRQQTLIQSFPEYMRMADQNATLNEQIQDVNKKVSEQEIAEGTKASIEFMKSYPDFAVTLYPGDRLEKVLADIFKTGENHPEFQNARRFGAVLNAISAGVFRSYEEAAESLFKAQKQKTEAVEQINNNQAQGAPVEPAGRATQPTGGGELLNRLSQRGKGAKYANLGRS